MLEIILNVNSIGGMLETILSVNYSIKGMLEINQDEK